ncbi:alpha/beta fold hydrolase [Phaeobacter gallaeciensis]|uniref:alpha/beta fold hydrolase n=1 Tax=Phaeobacter gallaeciensis TaxID=60890 RepID=UPI00237F90FA|nr:alpha/beta hydrolase [Phaeobacter gallaeciensis]MDE4192644.1 alpha/beta hydrolase [Phaeobacter gallaeciensis]MDE4200889.1 alpha/beta hydrolase [Phaeobacter gallaeciensis]MDE4205042.1 alpha/beta hydrolase [Phaeobacter gallaeciensis]MDE4209181.1 alpha/beta hydrolase [Phaeobacter gallaeciensis]MDE4217767.1 alpha/beta hydrolase [Phaeobacter gallaeciensis]
MASEIETGRAEVNGQTIAYTQQGSGPAVLLLHGFPQTRAMWDTVAPRLAEQFTVVTADLRGYGDSSKPDDMTAMNFREMGADQVALMRSLGHESFHLVGHDRGARTAHRMALDSPNAIASLTVMDIIPTHLLLGDLHQEVARAYYHWFFLAQPAPFPERMIGADPDYYFESCLLGWGGATLEDFPAEALEAYRKSWRDPACIHAMCNDYRAAIDVDFALDAADLDRQVSSPALVLYGATGAMAKQYDVEATWAPRLANMRAAAIPGGHFFVDQHPSKTAEALMDFLSEQPAF